MKRLVCFALLSLAACSGSAGTGSVAHRVISTPLPTGRATVTVHLPDRRDAGPPDASAKAPAPTARRAAPPRPVAPDLQAFKRLGSWIDVFDYTNDPATIRPLVAAMAKQATKTLYLETATRHAKDPASGDIRFPRSVGVALDEAKARGMRVVAWYPPTFDDLERDLRRSLAAVRFTSPHGNHFDAFAADIEYTEGVPDAAERSKRAIAYSQQLRARVAKAYALAAIVIPPTSLEMNAQRWPDFPWTALAPSYDVFMPMNYWTAHGEDPATASTLTRENTAQTRQLTGRPVHIIGGLGEDADVAQVKAYVASAIEAGSLGGGLYDFRTTKAGVWGELRRFNR